MFASPASIAITADDDRENLTGTAIVDGRAEGRIDAEPAGHQLMVGVDVIRPAHHDAVDILDRQAGVGECLFYGHFQKPERIGADLAELAVASADDGVFVPHAGIHVSSCS